MTQAQVVGDEVSSAYLSRIEDGQRRPEVGLLERMAARMGVSLEQLLLDAPRDKLLELQLRVDHAELALASGEAQKAIATVDEVLVDAAISGAPPVQLAARRVRAGALEATGDLNGAILALEELVASPTPDAHWLKSLIALSRCYRDNGEFARAISVGEQAAALIEDLGLEGLTEAIQLTITVAGAYFLQGDTPHAMRTCMQALEAAEKHDSTAAKASAYWNASVIEATRGSTQTAVDLARRALALLELGEDNRNLAKLRAEVANLHLLLDPPDAEAALAALARSERELTWSGASQCEVALVHVTRGRAHFLLGDLEAARGCGELALTLTPPTAATLRASALVLQGRIAFAEGHHERSRELYQQSAQALSATGADRSAAQLWFELAELLAEVGDTTGAMEAFRSAGASTGLRVASKAVSPQRT